MFRVIVFLAVLGACFVAAVGVSVTIGLVVLESTGSMLLAVIAIVGAGFLIQLLVRSVYNRITKRLQKFPSNGKSKSV